jgi:hypothetical protein
MIRAMRRLRWTICLVALASCGPFCGSFSLSNAGVDASHSCPQGSGQQPYDLHATVSADNPTSQAVTVKSADAAMVVATVHGRWQQSVGTRYDAGSVPFTPSTIPASSTTTLKLTIPSSCSNAAHTGTADNYADYTVELTIVTSAGTFKVTSQNKHRIVAP